MSSESPSRPLPKHPSVRWSRLRWRWPFLVWLAVAGVAWWLYSHGGEYIRVNGMVEVITESVSPLETGRIVRIPVIPGQKVEAGDVLAELDTTIIDEEIAVLEQRLRQERAEDERQFASAEQRLKSDLREYRLDYAEGLAELEIYEREAERIGRLVEQGVVATDELTDVQVDAARTRERLKLFPTYISELEAELTEMQALRRRILSLHEAELSDEAQRSRLNLLERKRDNMLLRAQQAGTVSRIRREPGEVVDAGERVIDVITERPRRILAFMNEADTRPINVDSIVEVEPAIGGARFKARVVALSPNVIGVPDRASPIPDRVVRGRRLELVPLESVDLTPGASVVVYLPQQQMFWNSLLGGKGQ